MYRRPPILSHHSNPLCGLTGGVELENVKLLPLNGRPPGVTPSLYFNTGAIPVAVVCA